MMREAGGSPSGRGAPLAMLVQQYGVSFELTKSVEERLRKLGADDSWAPMTRY